MFSQADGDSSLEEFSGKMYLSACSKSMMHQLCVYICKFQPNRLIHVN